MVQARQLARWAKFYLLNKQLLSFPVQFCILRARTKLKFSSEPDANGGLNPQLPAFHVKRQQKYSDLTKKNTFICAVFKLNL